MIEVWRIDLRRYGGDAAVLSVDEAERAARFRFEAGRRSFVAARSAARMLAGSRLGIAPDAVVFGYGPKGKPEVEGVALNVSHSGDLALIALGSGRIGVDVEELRSGVEMRALARRFFTRAENDALDRLSGDALVRGFFGLWTQKEALVKAVGEGLSGLGSLDGLPTEDWTVTGVDVGPGYAAAVAMDEANVGIVVRDWNEAAAA